MTMAEVEQRDAEWLRTAPAEEVVRAQAAGELAELLGERTDVQDEPADPIARQNIGWLQRATPEQIADAYASGGLDRALGRPGGTAA